MKTSTVKNIKKIKLGCHKNKKSSIIFCENFRMNIKRFIRITSNKNSIRGNHSNISSYIFLNLIDGEIKLLCDDGIKKKYFTLINSNELIIIPPKIWTKIFFIQKSTIDIFSNEIFKKKAYINNYQKFLTLKNNEN